MKTICCISDSHLGFRHRRSKKRLFDYKSAFEEALDKAMEHDPGLLILGGDMFHHPKPDPVSMRVFLRKVLSVAEKTPVVLCIGNHEIETALSSTYFPVFSDLHENISVLTSENPHAYFEIEGKKVGVHGFQYIRSKARAEEELERVSSEVGEADVEVLIIHQAVQGYLEPHEISLSSLREAAAKYDLVLSGHVHKHQKIKEISDLCPAYYVGATERVSFNEAENPAGFMVFSGFDFEDPEYVGVSAAKMKSVKKDLGKKAPGEVNSLIEKILEENKDAKCLQLKIDVDLSGDYFDVKADWDGDFSVLEVSVNPLSWDDSAFEDLSGDEDLIESYFEKTNRAERKELLALCKSLYQRYGNGTLLA